MLIEFVNQNKQNVVPYLLIKYDVLWEIRLLFYNYGLKCNWEMIIILNNSDFIINNNIRMYEVVLTWL